MSDPLRDRDQLAGLLTEVTEAARRYLNDLDGRPAGGGPSRDAAALAFRGRLPEQGDGSLPAITRLLSDGLEAAVNSAGPRFFHFVTGGSTPAALAADWLASMLDNNAGLWIS